MHSELGLPASCVAFLKYFAIVVTRPKYDQAGNDCKENSEQGEQKAGGLKRARDAPGRTKASFNSCIITCTSPHAARCRLQYDSE